MGGVPSHSLRGRVAKAVFVLDSFGEWVEAVDAVEVLSAIRRVLHAFGGQFRRLAARALNGGAARAARRPQASEVIPERLGMAARAARPAGEVCRGRHASSLQLIGSGASTRSFGSIQTVSFRWLSGRRGGPDMLVISRPHSLPVRDRLAVRLPRGFEILPRGFDPPQSITLQQAAIQTGEAVQASSKL